MRQLVLAFVVMAAAALGFLRYLDQVARSSHGNGANAMAMAVRPAPEPAPSSNYRTVTLNSDGRGYFQTDVRVDGRSIEFLVDTGAQSVTLRESSAARLGIHPSASDYNIRMQTA